MLDKYFSRKFIVVLVAIVFLWLLDAPNAIAVVVSAYVASQAVGQSIVKYGRMKFASRTDNDVMTDLDDDNVDYSKVQAGNVPAYAPKSE